MKAVDIINDASTREEAAALTHAIYSGEDMTGALTDHYLKNVEGVTRARAEHIVREVVDEVARFDESYARAREDAGELVDGYMERLDSAGTASQRCTFWLRLTALLTRLGDGDYIDRDGLNRELEGLNLSDEDATPERESELRGEARTAILNSGAMLMAIGGDASAVPEDMDELTELLLDIPDHGKEYRAALSVAACVLAARGELEDIPAESDPRQICDIVCAQVEAANVGSAVANGDITVDAAAALIAVIGTVLLTLLTVALAVWATVEVFEDLIVTLSLPSILAIPMTGVLVYAIMSVYMGACEMLNDRAPAIARSLTGSLRAIGRGLGAVRDYLGRTVGARVRGWAASVKSRLGHRRSESAVSVF